MIDEKRAYYFGRNPKTCDFIVEHASCSREFDTIYNIYLIFRMSRCFTLSQTFESFLSR
jgi:hypothetical protein